jgi:hypothetical protein
LATAMELKESSNERVCGLLARIFDPGRWPNE